MKTKTLMLAALAASTLVPSIASADAGRVEVAREVRFNDLDLTGEAGQRHFDQRIQVAVRRVCGGYDARVLAEAMQIKRCRREAMASAAVGRQFAMAQSARRTGVAMAVTPGIVK
jgi:UrcA family protein